MAATRTASLPDLPDDVLQLVFNLLCACDRLALAGVSTSWRKACAVDGMYITAAAAVLSIATTPTECNKFGHTRLGPLGGIQRDCRLVGEPFVPQASMASQRRMVLRCLRVVASLSKSYRALDLAAPAPDSALAWADTLSPFSPQHLARLLVRVRVRNDDGVSAWEAPQEWGIRLDTSWVDGADVHGVHVSGKDTPDVLFNLRAAFRVAFLDVGNVITPFGVTQCAAIRAVLTNLRRRARRVLVVRELVRNYTGSDVAVLPGPSGRRPYLIKWISMAMGVENAPILKFLDSTRTVNEAHVAALLGFLAAIYNQAAIAWPKQEQRRACSHWAPVEQHVVRVAVYAFGFGDTGGTIVADVAAHMACLGVARVCTSLGRRREPVPLRGRCGAPFLAGSISPSAWR